ncbi:LysR family transcriptional regulator [Gemella sp. zg-1178]|uniref:LysR family transcriptional regulator n=1 Tax=Gemella sp. zg-1178 TaxID=2840372 RepID=UPI001C03D755|nr:LysR family transcriptional regulator [Gemella sp. zg-1178]MBU0279246.1 LysR family transcriptional regulator [Gemella sp. zg-1178]
MDNKRKLDYLTKIITSKNITKAATELFVSQPYLSKFIKNIEEELEIKIFQKINGQINLTFAGERYLNYLTEIDKLEQKMQSEFDLIRNNKKGKIRLGINPALATAMLYKVIPQFKQTNPNIMIELFEKNQNISEEMLENNQLDVVIGMSPIFNEKLSYNIIYTENMYLFAPKSSKLYNGKIKDITKFSKSLALLNNEPIILTPLQYGIGKMVENFFKKNNLELNTSITTSTVPTAVNLAKSGMGCTFIPENLINNYLEEDATIYSFKKTDIKAEYIAIFRKNEQLPQITINLLNTILENLKK